MRVVSIASILILSVAAVLPLGADCTPPSITVTPANPTCGSPATLDAGSGWATYHWTDSNGNDFGTSETMTTDFSGTYSVAVSDASGCATSASVDVSVTDFSIARAPSAACPNALIQSVEVVGVSGTPSYSWTITNGAIVNDYGRSVDVTISGSDTAVLTATVDDGTGCVMSKSVSIAVASPLTSASIAAAAPTICAGGSTTVTATATGGSGSYTYVWHAYGDTVNASSQTITVSPTADAWYYADVIDNYGCGQTTTPAVQVKVTQIDSTIAAPDYACANTVSNASGPELTGSPSYSWSIDSGGTIAWGANTNGIGFTPGPVGSTLTLAVTNNGCTSTSRKWVATSQPPAQPVITASGPTTFCSVNSVVLTASAASSYAWSDGETTQSITVNSSGTYSVTVANAAGCTSAPSNPVTVTALSGPVATVTGGSGATICAGSSTTISASLIGSAPFTLTWSDGFVQTVANGTTATRSVSPASTTSYSITNVSDATGCPGRTGGSAYVNVRTPPTATVSGATTICAGSAATITAAITLTDYPVTLTWSDGFVQKLWSGTTATRDVTPAATTTYTVTSVSDTYCSGTSSGSAVITVDTAPAITSQPASITIKKNSTTTLSVAASSTRPISYQWYRGTSGDATNPIAGATTSSYTTPRLSSTTSFWVVVSNSCGATNSATATVTIP